MASFVKLIDEFDSTHGIPRPADSQHLTPFHAFLRLTRHVSVMAVVVTCGCISSYLLWCCAGWLQVTKETRLFFVLGMLVCLCVSFLEAAHEVLPYYRIKQRLTYGTARWADESYLRSTAGLALKVGENGEGLPKGAVRIGKLRRGYSLVLPPDEWLRHIAIFGPPGSGKSKTFLMNMLRDVANGGSAIVLDPKGELYEQTAWAFKNVYRLDLLSPFRSDRWNFVPQCKNDHEFASQMAATMIGLEGTKFVQSDPFWQESSLLLLTTVLLHLSDVVDNPTPPMIFEYLGMRDMAAIDAEMSNTKNATVRNMWGAFKKGSSGTQGNVITSLMNKLAPFEIRNAQAVCAPITENDRRAGVRMIDFSRLREEGTAIFIVIAEGDATRYKNVLSTFLGQAVNQLRVEGSSEGLAPVNFCLDEAANVPLVGLKEIVGVGRGRRIGLTLGYQNMPQTQDQYNHDGAGAILGSVGTMIFLPGLDDATSQFASRRIGQTTVWSHTTIDAKGKKNDSERQSETGRALMDPTEVRQMVKHKQCVVVIDTSPPIKASYPPYAMRRQRALAPEYGDPILVSLITAEEEKIEKAAQAYREKKMKAAMARLDGNEEEADRLEAELEGSNFSARDAAAPDEIYQKIYERLADGKLAEPTSAEAQSPFAMLVNAHYKTGQISKWEDIRDLDLKVMRSLGLIKTGLPLNEAVAQSVEIQAAVVSPPVVAPPPVVAVPPAPVAMVPPPAVMSGVTGGSSPPASSTRSGVQGNVNGGNSGNAGGRRVVDPNQAVLGFLSDDELAGAIADTARVAITKRGRSERGRAMATVSSYKKEKAGDGSVAATAGVVVGGGTPAMVQDSLR